MKPFLNFWLSLVLLFVIFLPFFVSAATFRNFVLLTVKPIVNALLLILYSFSILVFLWGLAKFILKAGEETERAKGKKLMTWGVVALFILGTFNGIVFILSRTLFSVNSPDFLPESGSDFTI